MRRLAAGVLIAVGAAQAASWLPAGYPTEERAVVGFLMGAGLVCAGLLLLDELRAALPRQATAPLFLAALLAMGAWTSFGRFHGRTQVHYWEQFHHDLGAKYFPELGWDGLYAASIRAEQSLHATRPIATYTRDLRDDRIVPVASASFRAHQGEVMARFSHERAVAFSKDQLVFLKYVTDGHLTKMRRDHGMNASPFWVAVARPIVEAFELDQDALKWLASIDLVLVAGAIAALTWGFGGRVGALAAVLFGTTYLGRYFWVGGALLREDWLCLSAIGLAFLGRERPFAAGAAFALAAGSRIFPALFLLGPLVVYANGRAWRPLGWLVAGAAAGGLVVLGLGSLAGRGPEAWVEFAGELDRHRQKWMTNNLGLGNVVLYGRPIWEGTLLDPGGEDVWVRWRAYLDARTVSHGPLILALKVGLLGLLVAACRRVRPAEAAALCVFAVFALTLSTTYYWQMLALLAVVPLRRARYGVLALNVLMCAVHLRFKPFDVRYGIASWLILALALLVLGTLARRREPAPA